MEPYFRIKSLEKFGTGYVRDNYDVLGKLSNKFMSNDPNLISRLRSLLVDAMQKQVILPRYVVMVLDDDILKFLGLEAKAGVAKAIGRILNEIMTDTRKLIQRQKEYLEKKSKREMFPQVVWIEAPYHQNYQNNDLRQIYNEVLNKVAQFNEDVTVLQLKKIWDHENGRLFLADSSRYTAQGYATYWAAIDCTLRFMDTILIDKILNKSKKSQKKERAKSSGKPPLRGNNKFKWQSESYKKAKKPKRREVPRKRLQFDDTSSDDYYLETEGRRKLPKPTSQSVF